MRNIISFSLYGNNSMYTVGALKNVELSKKYYPGWVCKFYVNQFVKQSVVNELLKTGAEVKVIAAPVDFKSKFVRMEVAVEQIDRFIIRDCDSRLNRKEADAVQEWIKSGKAVHIMRDHKLHTSPMMGGMWGAVKGFIPDELFLKLYREWITSLRAGKFKGKEYCKNHGQSDQGFLAHKIYPLIKDNCLTHTSHKKFSEYDKPFPSKLRYGWFVGQQVRANNSRIKP